LAFTEKEVKQARKDNQALTRYINARRKKEARKAEGEVRKKTMVVTQRSDEGQSSKDVRTWRK
jgi:hypothetical protein